MRKSRGTYDARTAVMTLIAMSAMTLALWNLFFGYSAFGQARRMELAGKHKSIVEKCISSDSRFARIDVGPTSFGDGCFLVHGRVVSEADLEVLKKIVSSTNPPVEVRYMVSTVPDDHKP